MISLLFWVLAAVSNAVMDTLNHHYYTSIFKSSNEKHNQWWNPDFSWKNKYTFGNKDYGRNMKWIVITDAFHFFKGLMLMFLVLSVLTFDNFYFLDFHIVTVPIITLIYVLFWWAFFELFYKYILRNKI